MAVTKINADPAWYRVSAKAKIWQGDKVILVKEDYKTWDFPGGGVEHEETIEEGLRRELQEEMGLTEFKITGGPRLFKMIDRSAGRPLLFLLFEVEIPENCELKAAGNVEIGRFKPSEIPDFVNYSQEYADFARED